MKLPTSVGSLKNQESSRKTSTSALLNMPKPLTVDHKKQKNSSRDGNTRSPELPLEKPVCRSGSNRTGCGTTDWFPIGKGVHQGYILSPCSFNLYAEYIIGNAGVEEAQAEIKIAGRNINNLRYADDTAVMADNKEKLKSILMKVKEKIDELKVNIQMTQFIVSITIISWQIYGETMETVKDFVLGGLQNHFW